ncbi:type II secretion system inner membrane protein GspF [Burkholderia plantarii]|uniref:General secretion pathway protein F n=1 Tax=Burkholderia plantarii TaxID=41899 RepID=A0A0B6RXF7_BURPL|nr:type II secretion system inner membrane protein GspF [Burkholderia plantarii]AJK50052.1 general secretion pathway protein F [Burkholderia plantarii]WLE63274.1 type II secretion system inner membrane protein GspF [Burkholderia plantarii]
MSAFRYEAIDQSGRTLKGVLEADSARAGRGQLRGQGLTPLVVEPAAQRRDGRRRQRLALGRKLSQREQAILTRQLASLLIAGLPLSESLSVLSEQAEREYVRELMASIRGEVVGGHTFANALTQHPADFPEIYRALVAAGEHTGKLGIVLSRLADYIEQSNALKQKIVLAFTYPAVVTMIAFGIVTFLLSYVVPQVANVFTSTKQALPTLTIVMLALSNFVRHWWWATLAAIALVVFLAGRILARPKPRLAFDAWSLRAPLMGKIVRGYNTVRFASTLGILSAAGVPILRALQAAGETLSNRAMRANIDDAIVRVREGSSLSRALNHVKTFPPVLIHLIRSGEATGDVTTMLDRAAEGESRELERKTMFLTSLLEPLLILAMGGVVLVIVLAVMMPIIELNNMVQ